MFTDLRPFYQRLIFSLLGLAVLFLIVYLSWLPFFRPLFALVSSGAIALALWEFYRICEFKGYEPLDTLGVLGSFVYAFSYYLQSEIPYTLYLPQVILFGLLVLGFIYFFSTGKRPLINLSMTYFGFLYLAIPLSFALEIFYFHPHNGDGRWWFLYFLAVIKLTDIGAYVIGKLIGRNLMTPVISPKKTWEGSIGGLLTGILTSVLFFEFLSTKLELGHGPPPLSVAIGLGALLSIAAQFGDLAESLIKRDAGVKDSNQLPGLGGMLDILDSLVFAAPVLYFYLAVQ